MTPSEFNRKYPVGSVLTYREGMTIEKKVKITKQAWTESDNTYMVRVSGVSHPVSIISLSE